MRILSGGAGTGVDEGNAKAVTRFTLAAGNMSGKKVTAIIAMTSELLRRRDANRLIVAELQKVVSSKTNAVFLASLTATTAAKPTDGTATDCVQAALDVVDDAGYVVIAAPLAFVRKLAAESDGRIGLTGGELFPGCQVIGTSAAGSSLYAIPADRVAIDDQALTLLPASEASIELDDAPTGGATSLVSLWQNNMAAVLCERYFFVNGTAAVMVLS